MSSIDLLRITNCACPPGWALGSVLTARADAVAVASALEESRKTTDAAAVLVWDNSLGAPDPALLGEFAASPLDCWHGGLTLGMGGLPGILDFISPTWMLACDPPAEIEATSWRLSFRACLVKSEALRKLGGLRPEFKALEAAALEMGHRWIRRGALMRHVPRLVRFQPSTFSPQPSPLPLPFEDELRFAYYRFGRKWAAWGLFRAVMTRYTSLPTALRSWRAVMSAPRAPDPPPYRACSRTSVSPCDGEMARARCAPSAGSALSFELSAFNPQPRVSVLIPTVDRYPYLRVLLDQLRRQTVSPLEIIIVDQTAKERRVELGQEFPDLPLKIILQEEAGQCSSRNAGLQLARGDYVLFLDDDVEVSPEIIERHLSTLAEFGAEVSSGVAEEAGAGALPEDFRLLRASDVFPAGNSLARWDVLRRSGLFDLAYNRGQRADGDLGMRMYLSGGLMVLNPAISVFHHHAPSGGLRKSKARTVTYAMSRRSVFCRALVSVSDIYLAGRYFPSTHVREMLWQSILGSLSVRGGFGKGLGKVLVSAVFLPHSLLTLRERIRRATEMAGAFPRIPQLERPSVEACRSDTPSQPVVAATECPRVPARPCL